MNEIQVPLHLLSSVAFFQNNYDSISFVQDKDTRKQSISGSDVCRYCGKKKPEVAFTDECHALANSIGNRSLFAEDECEKCNKFFGRTIENDFGNWSLPYRVVSCVKGKNGFPSIKRDGWRMESGEDGWKIEMFTEHEIAKIDEETKTIYLPLPRDAFTPVMVYKAFVRMALSMLPHDQLSEFQDVISWLKNEDPTAIVLNQCTKIAVSEHSVFPEYNKVAAYLYRRKNSDKSLPYMIFVLAFANYAFQCYLPAPKDTQNENDLRSDLHYLLTGPHRQPVLPAVFVLSGTEKVRNEIVKFTIGSLDMKGEEHSWYQNVARRAYSMWEEGGRIHGFDQDHWFEAERLLRQEGEARRKKFFPERPKKK